jgi:hypothetical protein
LGLAKVITVLAKDGTTNLLIWRGCDASGAKQPYFPVAFRGLRHSTTSSEDLLVILCETVKGYRHRVHRIEPVAP